MGGEPMIANVYVDGFNLFYGALRGSPYRWLDLGALSRVLLPNDDIHRIRYFTARVTSRPHDPGKSQRQDVYLRALRTIPGLTIHLGHYLTSAVRMPLASPQPGGPRTVEVIKTEEKGSDVNLATYLLLDACRGDCEVAVVVTNDSDLKEPVAIVRRELDMTVGVINPHPPAKRSRALQPSFFKQLRTGAIVRCQFPDPVIGSHGKIHKPAEW
jgi:uncharacterized LabA/DUF88 family protein